MSAARGSTQTSIVARTFAVVGVAVSLVLTTLVDPAAAATVYTGLTTAPADLTLQDGDVLQGDLQVAGMLTVPAGVSVRVLGSRTVTAARIVVAGSLDSRGGATAAGLGSGIVSSARVVACSAIPA